MSDFPCFVYRNLNRGGWSVRSCTGQTKGRVVAHADLVCLDDATFEVSEKGRQRVLAQGRKNVHAGISGTLRGLVGTLTDYGVMDEIIIHESTESQDPIIQGAMTEISYSPFLGPNFFSLDDWSPAHSSKQVLLDSDSRVFALYPINDNYLLQGC